MCLCFFQTANSRVSGVVQHLSSQQRGEPDFHSSDRYVLSPEVDWWLRTVANRFEWRHLQTCLRMPSSDFAMRKLISDYHLGGWKTTDSQTIGEPFTVTPQGYHAIS